MLTIDTPEAVGLDPRRWQRALDLVQAWTEGGQIPAAGLIVGRSGKTTGVHLFGKQTLSTDSAAIREDAVFLVASITKPIVALGILLLAERGLITLDDRVKRFVPQFGQHGKQSVTVRHLLTHTSGLPDMLPDHQELRAAHAPLSAFVEGTCKQELAFPAGCGVQYQSMGFVMLGEIIQRLSGKTCRQFLHDEIFKPLEMYDTSLGAPSGWFVGPEPTVDRIAEIRLTVDRIAEIRLSEQQRAADTGNRNSRYWRQLGAPWGGLLTTPADLSRFAQLMLDGGSYGERQLISPAAIQAATCNQLTCMSKIPEIDRRCHPWGLGWRLYRQADSSHFGNFLSPASYGHSGATGTLLWIDPDRQAFMVFLTTQPQDPRGSFLALLSNAVVAAILDTTWR